MNHHAPNIYDITHVHIDVCTSNVNELQHDSVSEDDRACANWYNKLNIATGASHNMRNIEY